MRLPRVRMTRHPGEGAQAIAAAARTITRVGTLKLGR